MWEEIPPQKIKNFCTKSTLFSFEPPTNNDDVVLLEDGDTAGADIGGNGDDDELVEDNVDDYVHAEGVVNDTVVTDDEEVGDEEAKKIYELAADFTKNNSLEPRSASDTPDKFEDSLREMMATVEECYGEDVFVFISGHRAQVTCSL